MAATMHVATAMIAPLRLSGITPRLSITRTASMAILIKAQAMSRSLPFTGEYAPGRQFPARPAATIKLTHYRTFPRALAYWPVYPLVAGAELHWPNWELQKCHGCRMLISHRCRNRTLRARCKQSRSRQTRDCAAQESPGDRVPARGFPLSEPVSCHSPRPLFPLPR